jgi:hypothetical protein
MYTPYGYLGCLQLLAAQCGFWCPDVRGICFACGGAGNSGMLGMHPLRHVPYVFRYAWTRSMEHNAGYDLRAPPHALWTTFFI